MQKQLKKPRNTNWWKNLTPEQRAKHARRCVPRCNAQVGKPHSNPDAIRQSVLSWQKSHPEWFETISGSNNLNWKGGRSRNAHLKYKMFTWRRRAGEIRKRDNNTCRTCYQVGDKPNNRLEVNHLDGDFWNWLSTNLITQCEHCHKSTDKIRRIAKRN